MLYYFYYIHSFDNTGKDESTQGTLGNNIINMVKPRITIRLYKDLSVGIEHNIYFNDHYQNYYSPLHYVQTEQRIFLMLYFEDPQRRGHYN
jgi:hypothetical protein